MLLLEDSQNKKELIEQFFLWLFDDEKINDSSISLKSEIDLSMSPYYIDSNIYYPKQIEAFFATKPMERLSKISQLALAINENSNLYHNRLEHSKGVYNKKLEEFFYKYQDLSWRKNVEEKHLKLYIIAELIKIAGHDIGHPIFSHPFEIQIFNQRGIHEEIGKRIMLENPEIQKVLSDISPDLNNIMTQLYNKDLFNFKQHDDSNYDVDRIDYLSRDSLYLGYKTFLPFQNYTSICISTKNNEPICNTDGSIKENKNGNSFIDVYDFSSLNEIENTLLLRESRYSNVYLSKNTQIAENNIRNFINAFLSTNSNIGINLKHFLLSLKNKSVNDINLNEYIRWNDINWFSELLDVSQSHENPKIRDLATMVIPNMDSFLNLVYSHLNIKNNSYTEYEKAFLLKLKNLIKNNSKLYKNLTNKNYIMEQIVLLPDNLSFVDDKYINLITKCSSNIYLYNKKEPIYIKDSNGKIFELSKHPNRTQNWNNRKLSINFNFANIPYLQFMGVPDFEINKILSHSLNNLEINNAMNKNINMKLLQTNHNIEDLFMEL